MGSYTIHMDDNPTLSSYASLFDLPEEHTLTLANSSKVKQDSAVLETQWLDERDEELNLVGRFRTWTSRQNKPPYKRQLGWERYSVSGQLLDREVRYSQRSDHEYLH